MPSIALQTCVVKSLMFVAILARSRRSKDVACDSQKALHVCMSNGYIAYVIIGMFFLRMHKVQMMRNKYLVCI